MAATLAFGLTLSGNAAGHELQWHVGAAFGYAMASFPAATAHGFGGGPHLSLGVTDALDLRVDLDVSRYVLPAAEGEESGPTMLIWSAAAGVQYLVDVLDWVPYVGALVGPVDVVIEGLDHNVDVAVEIPFGLGYHVHDNIVVGVEARVRMLPFAPDDNTTPGAQTLVLGRAEYLFGGRANDEP